MLKHGLGSFVAALALLGAAQAHAVPGASVLEFASNECVAVEFKAEAGLLNGTAYERVYVYVPGYKHRLSELVWDLKDVVMLGGTASLRLFDIFQLNIGGGFAANNGSGGMEDFDWMTMRTSAWSDWSCSDVDVEHAYMLDLNASVRLFRYNGLVVRGLFGYKRDDWKWRDFAGTYIYSSNPDDPRGFRDVHGNFNRETGIIYRQTYDIPYVGAEAGWVFKNLTLDAYVKYSPLVQAEDQDDHLMRNMRFEGTFKNGDYVGLGINAAWSFDFGLSLMAAIDYQLIPEFFGEMDVYRADEHYTSAKDTASVELNALRLSLAAGYRF